MVYYLYLGLAIIGELAGTLCLKYSNGFSKLTPSLMAVISYTICFIFLAKAFKGVNLSIAYATWSGVGIVAATLFSVFIFKEHLNIVGLLGIMLILVGATMLNFYGSVH